MSTTTSKSRLLVNASRIAPLGGLYAFTVEVLRCLARTGAPVAALVPADVVLPDGVERLPAPQWLAMRGAGSSPRSLFGLVYALVQGWRYRHWRVLSTMHLGLALHRNQAIVVHDLRPRFLPDTVAQGIYFRLLLPRILRRARGVITVSQTSKRELAKTYRIALERIYVVPNVLRAPLERVPQCDTAERPYLLMVNAGYRHKNAMELLLQYPLWSREYRLKILATPGEPRKQLHETASRLGLLPSIDFLPQASEVELATLYTHAAALVYPSQMEGFGLPPLEAMAYGTPVIVSESAVFREILADAPIYVRLGDAGSWQQAFEAIPAARAPERVEHGRGIAAQYTQQRMCAALDEALRGIWPDN